MELKIAESLQDRQIYKKKSTNKSKTKEKDMLLNFITTQYHHFDHKMCWYYNYGAIIFWSFFLKLFKLFWQECDSKKCNFCHHPWKSTFILYPRLFKDAFACNVN